MRKCGAFAGKPPVQNPLYLHFADKVDGLAEITAEDKQALKARCAAAIETGVVPAYRKLTGFLEGQLTRATTDDGVWKLPDSDAYYAYRLRVQTTTSMTPQQLHELGLSEVSRIEREMTGILLCSGTTAGGRDARQGTVALAHGSTLPVSEHRRRSRSRAQRLRSHDR